VSAEGTRIQYQEVQSRRENLIPAAGKPGARGTLVRLDTRPSLDIRRSPDIIPEIANAFDRFILRLAPPRRTSHL
jgi:hypothetical protein